MLSGMTRKSFVSSGLPQLRMSPSLSLKRTERDSAVSARSASKRLVFRSRRALPYEQYMMKPTSWFDVTFELGASSSVQKSARSLIASSPVAS